MATSGTSSIPTPEAPPCLGYVDHAPIVAPQARLGEWLFGDSVFAIRVLSAIAGAGTVILTCILAWAMGGRLPAQALAMFRVLVCSPFIGVDGFLSMNSFEPAFWMICVLALLLLLERGFRTALVAGLWRSRESWFAQQTLDALRAPKDHLPAARKASFSAIPLVR